MIFFNVDLGYAFCPILVWFPGLMDETTKEIVACCCNRVVAVLDLESL